VLALRDGRSLGDDKLGSLIAVVREAAGRAGQVGDSTWERAAACGWTSAELAEAFAYLALTIFTAYFLNYAQTLTTHYLDEAERLCDRLAIIDGGRIVACDTPARLLADLGEAILELRVAGDPAGALAALRAHGLPGDGAVVIGGTVTIPLRGFPPSHAMELASRLDVPVRELVTRVPTLDDVYLRLTGNRISPE
jgi:hypothetical protein